MNTLIIVGFAAFGYVLMQSSLRGPIVRAFSGERLPINIAAIAAGYYLPSLLSAARDRFDRIDEQLHEVKKLLKSR